MAEAMREPHKLGRYHVGDPIASGGTASVHLGLLHGSGGFSRTVAIKRLHPQYAKDPEFIAIFIDEARLTSHVRHPNVVPVLDVESLDGELFLVMDYVDGATLARLFELSCERRAPVPPRVAVAIVVQVLAGLHAAHEAKNERQEPLHLVHRDVSPQNVLVGTDGLARVVDFGIARALGRSRETKPGELKGKLPYMAPELLRLELATRSADVYSASVILWELLAGQRLFTGETDASIWMRVLNQQVKLASDVVSDVPPELAQVVARGLTRAPAGRYATARDMASELERWLGAASPEEVSAWVAALAASELADRRELVRRNESRGRKDAPEGAERAATHTKRAAYGVAVVFVLALFVIVQLARSVRTPTSAPATGPSASTATEEGAVDGPRNVSAQGAPTTAASTLVATTAAPSPAPPASGLAAPVLGKRSPARASSKAPADCDPPYLLDEVGHKRYRVECIGRVR